jgi:hypothetical protein
MPMNNTQRQVTGFGKITGESTDAVIATTMQILAGDCATTTHYAVCVVSAPPSQHTGSGDIDQPVSSHNGCSHIVTNSSLRCARTQVLHMFRETSIILP